MEEGLTHAFDFLVEFAIVVDFDPVRMTGPSELKFVINIDGLLQIILEIKFIMKKINIF